MPNIYRFFLSQRIELVFLILLTSLFVLPTLISNVIATLLSVDNWTMVDLAYTNTLFNTIAILIKAPILETFIYQFLPYMFLKKILKLKAFYIILLSATIFAGVHFYNYIYIIYAFFAGCILMFAYIVFTKRKFYPFLTLVIIHFTVNLIAYLAYL